MKHEHYWYYPHTQIEGRAENETAVVRYCACGRREVAFTGKWHKATGDYALDEHYPNSLPAACLIGRQVGR